MSGLSLDLYHLDAAYVSWRSGENAAATFDLYTRSAPFGGAYLLAAGLEPALAFVRDFRYSEDDLAWLAGLKGIPREFYEAAMIDGANGLQQTRHITFPMIAPVFTFMTVTGLMGGFASFVSIYLMTGGGPLNSTRVLGLEIYNMAFRRLWMGQATALAFILFAIVFTLTVLQLRMRRTSWEM